MQNAQKPIAQVDFVRVLFNKGFDKRMFNPANYGDKGPQLAELKISGKELYRVIKGADLTGNMPNECVGLSSGKSQSCKFEIETKAINYQTVQLTGYNIHLSMAGSAPANAFFYIGEDDTTLPPRRTGMAE